MPSSLRPGELYFQPASADQWISPVVDGDRRAHGLKPRNYDTHPLGCYSTIKPYHAVDMPLIPQSEWSARMADKAVAKSQLSDLRLAGNNGQPVPSRDQDGKGYCWAHSGVSCNLALRAAMNLPYVSLSAYAVACIIKQYQDEGGWGAEGVDFQMQRGVPTDKFWPQQSMSKANDKPETWANAALHKPTGGWIDLQAAQYDRNLSFAQVATCLLQDTPVVVDYNWWSHSVCALDLVDGAQEFGTLRDAVSGKLLDLHAFVRLWGMDDPVTTGFGVRIWNSWGDSWSDRGMGTLPSNKAVPDGSLALFDTLPAAA